MSELSPVANNNTIESSLASILTGISSLDSGVSLKDSANLDAFGRLRVSNPETIFDSKQLYDSQPLLWDDQQVSGAGTGSTHSTDLAATTMSVSANVIGTRIRQTFQRFNYQPGKSMLIMLTGILGDGIGLTRRCGYYDDNNGLFFSLESGTVKVVRRTSVTGSPVDNKVSQSDWNIDKMDGSGDSGIILDFDKAQLFLIDFEWLGLGRVRMGFVVNGRIYYCHQFLNGNSLSAVYMSTPNLPLRYEISNDGTGGAGTLQHVCSTVISEGGSQNLGIVRHDDSGTTGSLTIGTTYAVFGIKLKGSRLSASVIVEAVSLIVSTANDQAHWELRFNPTVASTFNFNGQAHSAVETAHGSAANTVTGGYSLQGGYFDSSLPFTVPLSNMLRLGASISGTPDTLVVCCRPMTSLSAEASMTWRELS